MKKQYEFRWAVAYRVPAALLGISPRTSHVTLGPEGLDVRFGLWRLHSALSNIASAEVTGDFKYLLTVGPPHLSLSDRGVSFTTNADEAVCVTFREPVKGIDPTGTILNPGATMSILEVDAFVKHLDDLQTAR